MNCFCNNEIPPIYKGDNAFISVSILDVLGNPVDLKDKTIKFIVKKSKAETDEEAVILKQYTPTESATEQTISLSKEETNIDPRVYTYAIRLIVNGIQTTEIVGKLQILQGGFYGV